MVNRREVLKLGAASVAGAFLDVPVGATAAASVDSRGALARAVFDERIEESVAFANTLKRKDVAVFAVNGDLARLWYGHFLTEFRRLPVPLAGLTDRPTLFCLEELARDIPMRVLLRIDHVID